MFKKLSKAGIFTQLLVMSAITALYLLTPQVRFTAVSDPEPTAPLGQWIYQLVTHWKPFTGYAVVLLMLVLALAMNAILIRHDISPRQSLFPAVLAMLLMLLTPDAYHLILTLACLVLLLFSLHNIMNLYGEQYLFNKVLNAAMSISIASMIAPPVLAFAVFIWLGFFTFRVNSWREWVISVMGLILPYFYLALMYLWNDNLMFAWKIYYRLVADFNFRLQQPAPLEFASLALFVVWILIAASGFLTDAGEKVISIRKKMWVTGHFALAGGLAALLSGGGFFAMLPVVFLPVAAMMAYVISNGRRSWLHDILLLLLLIFSLINRLNF